MSYLPTSRKEAYMPRSTTTAPASSKTESSSSSSSNYTAAPVNAAAASYEMAKKSATSNFTSAAVFAMNCFVPETPLVFLRSIHNNTGETFKAVSEFVAMQALWMLSGLWIVLATKFTTPAGEPLQKYRAASMAAGGGQLGVGLLTFLLLYCVPKTATKYLFGVALFEFAWSAVFYGVLTISVDSPYYDIKQVFYAHLGAGQLGAFVLASVLSMNLEYMKNVEWKKKAGYSAFISMILSIFLIILCVNPYRSKEKSALFLLVSNSVTTGVLAATLLLNDRFLKLIQWVALLLFLLSLATTGISTLDKDGGVFYDFSNGYLFHIVNCFILLSFCIRVNMLDFDKLDI